MNRNSKALALATLAALTGTALAAPAETSAYRTDGQSSYVQDQTADSIRQVNMIMCFVGAMAPGKMANKGDYAALVDSNICDAGKRGGNSSSNTGADYQRALVNVSRASNSAPMNGRIWVENEGDEQTSDIYVNLVATEAPGAGNPNGVFTLEYCAPLSGACFMQGKLEGTPNGLRYVERSQEMGGNGNGEGTLRLAVARNGNTGAGAIASNIPGQGALTYRFAYNETHFRRVKDGADDVCFDRRMDNAKVSAFRYGLYTTEGERVERNGGFPVTASVAGRNYQGFAGYWGLHFPPEVSGQLSTGATVTKQSFEQGAAGESFTLVKNDGRLMKFTRKTMELDKAKGLGIEFTPWQGLSQPTLDALFGSGSSNSIWGMNGGRRLEIVWNPSLTRFEVIGIHACTMQGCESSTVSNVAFSNADLDLLMTRGIGGFSKSLGGEVSVSAAVLTAVRNAPQTAGALSLNYRIADLIYPGAAGAPAQLSCIGDCPTAAGMASFFASSAEHPYGASRGRFQTASPLGYAFGSDGLLREGADAIVWSASNSGVQGPFAQGIRSGKLVPTDSLASVLCEGSQSNYCANSVDALDVYYVWETGPNPHNQFAGLKRNDNSFVTFDAPLSVTFNVPNRSNEFGTFAGASLQLQYNGFGDLFGIPSTCVNAITNEPVACGPGQGIRWVPSFSIPESLSEGVATDANGGSYLVKWLEREVRLSQVSGAQCTGLTPGSTADLPSLTGLRSPGIPGDPSYIGAKPTVTGAPRVVHGVVKY